MTVKALDIGTALPLDAVTQRAAVLGRTGSGKSHTLRVWMEELVGAGLPVVALDPMGGLWGLRSSASGKASGLPVTILGGEHGDIPLEPTAGAVVADLVVDEPSAYIVDLSSFDTDAEEDRFAEAFAYRLFRAKARNKAPMCLIVDEADRFAPQRPYKGQERMLGAFNTLSRRARQRGLGLVLATQRPASLNKHCLTQSELLVVHQVTGPQDRWAIDEWVTMHGTKEQRKEFLSTLATLERGEAWVWSPSWLRTFQRIRIRKARTFDSSKTPEPGDVPIEPKKLADVELAALRDRMAATIEKAKAEDPKELHRRIRELERLVKEQARSLEQRPPDVKEVERLVEVPAVPADVVATLAKLVDLAGDVYSAALALDEQGTSLGFAVEKLRKVEDWANARGAGTGEPRAASRGRTGPSSGSTAVGAGSPRPAKPAQASGQVRTSPSSTSELSTSQRAILAALADRADGRTRSQLGPLTGYRSDAGSFGNALSDLRERGLIVGGLRDDPITRITDLGIEAVPSDWEPMPRGRDLVAFWMARTGKRGLSKSQKLILAELVEVWPATLTRAELGERTGYRSDAGSFGGALRGLRGLELIEGHRGMKASDVLFEEA